MGGSLGGRWQRLRKRVAGDRPLEAADERLLVSIIFLIMFGLIMIYSATGSQGPGNLVKQAGIGAAGFVLMLAVSTFDYHNLLRFSPVLYPLGLLVLALVKTPLGVASHGATRWISLFGVQLQPSELLKPIIVLLTACILETYGEKLVYYRTNFFTILPAGIASLGILVLTKNLSTAIIVLGISVAMFFIAHPTNRVYVVLGGCLIAGIAGISWYYTQRIVPAYLEALQTGASSFENFRIGRIVAWLHPEEFRDLSDRLQSDNVRRGQPGYRPDNLNKLFNKPESSGVSWDKFL